ncbi:MAG: hypothetical protein N5P05_000312 [Chroococcopsis gigantea SAG 12.99]|nr:hypothetical protein [Chroococcopsis gigantea SAG 12.99]
MAGKRTYPTDLSDAEWEILSQLIPPAKKGGHPRITSMREVCNGIYYHLKTGCAWQFYQETFHRHQRYITTIVNGKKRAYGRI